MKIVSRGSRERVAAGGPDASARPMTEVVLSVAGEDVVLRPGDAASFHGDVGHSYRNDGGAAAGFAHTVFEPAGPR